MRKLKIILLFLLLFLLTSNISTIGAQTTNYTDLGLSVQINDQTVQNGDIICSGTDGYVLCKNEYDSSIFGVVNNTPSAAVQITNLTNSQVVVSKGETSLRVNSANGNIKVGDFLTTSKTSGVAELATNNGYVIGTALSAYNSTDKTTVGEIRVAMNIHSRSDIATSTRQNLVDLLRNGLSGLSLSPISALRYILAAIMVLISFIIGFIYFGRIAITGVQAIGRNPLAIGRIQISVIINILVMLGVVAVGLGVAYLILAI
ncbi:hypothetical protein BH10PAT1_BH10PAT1_1810 [soil metagenome]